MIITEIALTLFACIYLCFYAADVLYWIYENEVEKKEKAEASEEEEKMKEEIAKTLYS